MSQNYTIEHVFTDDNGGPVVKEWSSGFGKLYQYKVKFSEFHENVNLNKKPDSPAPEVGDEVYGDITTREWTSPDGETIEFYNFKSQQRPDGYQKARETADKIKGGAQRGKDEAIQSQPAGKTAGKQPATDKYLKDTSDVPRSLVIELLKYYDVQSLYNSQKYTEMIKLAKSLNDDIMQMIKTNRGEEDLTEVVEEIFDDQ